jgi:hypothetical protein
MLDWRHGERNARIDVRSPEEASGRARIIETQADHSRQLLRLREDINNLRSDDLRRETMQVQMDTRLDRIETRLNLHDAE